jgi:hypothetical protein
MNDNDPVAGRIPAQVRIDFGFTQGLLETSFQVVAAETESPLSERRGWFARTERMAIDFDGDNLIVCFENIDSEWRDMFLEWVESAENYYGLEDVDASEFLGDDEDDDDEAW